MFIHNRNEEDDFFPRMIIWQLTGESLAHNEAEPVVREAGVLSTHECLLTIDSISRVAKPIIVLTGKGVVERPDLFQIVEYGFALGLKMIIEVYPQELTDDLMGRFVKFGPKVFRVLLDGAIMEDMDTRFKQSVQYQILEDCLRRLKKSGYEIHLGINIENPDVRQLAFEHDFALQKSANGLYCHLTWDSTLITDKDKIAESDHLIEQFIYKIAQMKRLSPKGMYFSPQCIKYGLQDIPVPPEESSNRDGHKIRVEWTHWCLAGRSFIFIGPAGTIQPCAALNMNCGTLRDNNYDFKKIWFESEILNKLRVDVLSCPGVRELLHDHPLAENSEKKK
jgi:MoaA/NifB/PqqE/SkfB family radical SAM enzyme